MALLLLDSPLPPVLVARLGGLRFEPAPRIECVLTRTRVESPRSLIC